MTTGDSVWTGDRSRAEMPIGSTAIRVDGQTMMSFLNLDDQTVLIQLTTGTIDVHVRNLYGDDVFEVDTPNLAFTMLQRGHYRITVDPDGNFTTITLRDGQGHVTGGGKAFLVDGGSQIQVSGTDDWAGGLSRTTEPAAEAGSGFRRVVKRTRTCARGAPSTLRRSSSSWACRPGRETWESASEWRGSRWRRARCTCPRTGRARPTSPT